ncbi:sarcosine oxidase subunit gamma [Burkholderia sp. Z1]|uniref:sarcosine oxidase subunit gamma n=1 Tax=Burkholderia sp. Z1 TaxID=2759039 RepID=UPI001866888C|nr:sarcosine oxidase subunit gamma family protein [Burkholderia sp. Z1]
MHDLQARSTVTSHLVTGRVFRIAAPSLQLSEIPLHGLVRIQGDGKSSKLKASIEAGLGVALPLPERSTLIGTTRLVWVGPNEWLVLCALEDEAAIVRNLTNSLANQFVAVTLVSDARVSFLVSGGEAVDFLAKGCGIDLDATVFPVDAAVTTRFAGLPAMLLRRATFEYVLYFDVSMAGFLVDWMTDAAEEFEA